MGETFGVLAACHLGRTSPPLTFLTFGVLTALQMLQISAELFGVLAACHLGRTAPPPTLPHEVLQGRGVRLALRP